MENTIYNLDYPYYSLGLTNYVTEKHLSEKQCDFLKSVYPLIDSCDDESVLLGISFLKQEGWNKVHITDNKYSTYSISELMFRIEGGSVNYSILLAIIINGIIITKKYYEHRISFEG